MTRISSWLLAAAWIIIPAWTASAKPPVSAGALDAVFKTADTASSLGDCSAVVRALRPHLNDPALASYPPAVQSAVLDMLVQCEVQRDANDDAYHDALIGTRNDAASDDLWHVRLELEVQAEKLDEAVITIAAMQDGRGAALNAVSPSWLFQLDTKLKAGRKTAQRKRLLAMLIAPAYQPAELPSPGDGFRRSDVELLLDTGDNVEAFAIAKEVKAPGILIAFSVDPRLRSVIPADFDIRAASEAYLADMTAQSVVHPESLNLRLEQADLLRQLGRRQAALDLLLNSRPALPNGQVYDDAQDKLIWWWDSLARVYASLGQYDQMLNAFRQGGRLDESGSLNVSQVINLADAQIVFGHPQDALTTLAAFESSKHSLSAYGEMMLRLNHGCASAKLGNKVQMQADLDFVRAHDADADDALRGLLLCSGDMDATAAAFIHDLDDPDRRSGALLQLSEYDPPLPNMVFGDDTNRLPALKARPDVHAAIERAGGIRRIHLQRGQL